MWKIACFIENTRWNTTEGETILYLSDHATGSDSLLAALKATGYEVMSTTSSTQAIALLFVTHSVVAVVLNQQAKEQTTCTLARSLPAIRPDVRIVLLCGDQFDPLPTCVVACVTTGQSLENLISSVRCLLTANRPFAGVVGLIHCD